MTRNVLQSGLLPIKLLSGADKRELDRAKFLLRSLSRNWRGTSGFEVHLVGLDDEINEIRGEINSISAALQNLKLHFHSELEFFGKDSPFYTCSGTYKQQLIKMFAPPRLGLGPFITLDADVVCVAPFHETTFVRDGKLVSAWEPRNIHAWWENSMTGIRAWTDLKARGLGVTPNVLHSDICQMIQSYFSHRGLNALDELVKLTVFHPDFQSYEHERGFALVWSEYSLYNIVGEWFGSIDLYHMSAAEVDRSGVSVQSIRSVWGADSVERLTIHRNAPGNFIIVQSWSGVAIEEVARRLGVFYE